MAHRVAFRVVVIGKHRGISNLAQTLTTHKKSKRTDDKKYPQRGCGILWLTSRHVIHFCPRNFAELRKISPWHVDGRALLTAPATVYDS